MTNHNLRYYALGSLTGLTIVGWLLDKLTPDITMAVFGAVGAIVAIDMIKHKND